MKRRWLFKQVCKTGALTAVASLVYVANAPVDMHWVPPTPADSQVQRLMDRHGCWSGEAPADMEGKYPKGVVFTIRGTGDVLYAVGPEVGWSLDSVFGKDPNWARDVRVNGFCRGRAV